MELINRIRKSRKGFTLVEIIVVLVILAILAAFTIPAMLGFVKDAKSKAHVAEAREVYLAAQAAATEKVATQTGTNVTGNDLGIELGKATATAVPSNTTMKKYIDADIPTGAIWTVTATGGSAAATGKIEKIVYTVDGVTITIDKTASGTGAAVVSP